MPELRQDPLSGRWVVVATGRAKRPEAFVPSQRPGSLPAHDPSCCFCPGNEHTTPPEVTATRPAGSRANDPDWSLRVVPNKFAAFDGSDGGDPDTPPSRLQVRQAAFGTSEVIIETRRHDRTLARATDAEIALIIGSYLERYRSLQAHPGYAYLQVFRNYGTFAGASQEHPHSQLIAMPEVPAAISTELDRIRRYYASHGQCLLCDILQHERAEGGRIVFDDGEFLALAPFASRSPFELLLAPLRHEADFARLDELGAAGFARALGATMRILDRALHDPPYNYYLRTTPPGQLGDDRACAHWYLTVLPRLTVPAGFELGTGTQINITLPEAAAAFLREHR